MQYTTLGQTDLNVSRLCLGTMTFGWSADKSTSFAIMDAALDTGINFFDTADIYSKWIEGNSGGESEAIIGEWLKGKPRDRVIIATKVRGEMWRGDDGEGLGRAHITRAIEDSLRRLQTDTIDLYQTHWPDDNVSLEETLTVLNELVKAGKVRYIGCSNHPPGLLQETLRVSQEHDIVRYESLQPHHSIFHRKEYEAELAAICAENNIGVIPYSPLAAGFATGKYTRKNKQPDSTRSGGGLIQSLINDEDAYAALDIMREIASGHGVPVAQIALAWQLTKPSVTSPIIGARTVQQLEQVAGATDVTLAAEEITQLDEATTKF